MNRRVSGAAPYLASLQADFRYYALTPRRDRSVVAMRRAAESFAVLTDERRRGFGKKPVAWFAPVPPLRADTAKVRKSSPVRNDVATDGGRAAHVANDFPILSLLGECPVGRRPIVASGLRRK